MNQDYVSPMLPLGALLFSLTVVWMLATCH